MTTANPLCFASVLVKTDHIGTCLFAPVLKVVFAYLGPSLERVPHVVSAVHHKAHVVDTFRVILTVALATKEDCITNSPIGKLDFPAHCVSSVGDLLGGNLTHTSTFPQMRNTCCVSLVAPQRKDPFP